MPFQAPPWINLQYPRNSRVPDLILASGQAQADGAMRSGAIWGNATRELGGIAAGGVVAHQEQKMEQARSAALMDLLQKTDADPSPMALVRLYGPDGIKIAQGFRDIRRMDEEVRAKRGDRALQHLPGVVNALDALPENDRAQLYPGARPIVLAAIEASGLSGQVPEELIPEKYVPEVWPRVKAFLGLNPEKKGAPHVVKDALVDPTGKVLYQAPKEAPKPPNRTGEEEFIFRKYGENPTPEQLLEARAAFAKAGREPEKAGDGLPPDRRRRVDQLSDKFLSDPVVKRANTVAEGYTFVSSLDPNTTNPADDQGLIYAFAKAMDPDSAVREGEYATVEKYAQSWVDKFGFNAKRVVSGTEFLTPQARANLKATIKSKYEASRKGYENIRAQFGQQINQVTGKSDGNSYLVDYGAGMPQTGAPKSDGPKEGSVEGGYRFKGGDPADPANWEKVK